MIDRNCFESLATHRRLDIALTAPHTRVTDARVAHLHSRACEA